MPYGPVIPHTKAHRRKAVKGGPVHLEESCEEFKRASWEVQKKYHFALPRIKGIEKLDRRRRIHGCGFPPDHGHDLYRHRGKVIPGGLMEGLHT